MKKIISATLLMSAIFICSCKKSQTNQQTQTVTGNVAMVDATDSFLITNNITGTTVALQNANTTLNLPVSSTGNFTIPNINTTGNITLTYSHAGYGVFKQFFTHLQFDSLKTGLLGASATLHPSSKVVVNSLSGTLQNNTLQLNCNVSFPGQTGIKYVAFVHQKNNPLISLNNIQGTQNVAGSYPVIQGDNSINICLCSEECKSYLPGDTLYIKAFGSVETKYGDDCYFDPTINGMIYPSINQNSNSQTLSFVIPKN